MFQYLMKNGELPKNVDMGDIEALGGVSKFPARIKCALLGWKTLEQAIDASTPSSKGIVTTDNEEQ